MSNDPKNANQPKSGLIGLYVHLFHKNGFIEDEGKIIGEHGDYFIIQTFDGDELATIKLMSIAELADEFRVRLYPNRKVMKSFCSCDEEEYDGTETFN